MAIKFCVKQTGGRILARYGLGPTNIPFRPAEINPFERKWLRVDRANPQNLKFIEGRSRLLIESLLGLSRFLDRVFVFLAVGWPFLFSFERDVLLSKVDSDKRNADWIASASFIPSYAIAHLLDMTD